MRRLSTALVAMCLLLVESGHNIHVDNPQLVARAIEEVVEAAMKGLRLTP